MLLGRQSVRRPGALQRWAPVRALGASPLLAAVAVQSVANLGYHAVVGRLLPAEQYGALGAVLAAMTLVAVPLTALQTAAARTTASHGLTRATARRAARRTAGWFTAGSLVLLSLSPAVADYLRLPSALDAALLAPALVVAGLLAAARGMLLGVAQVRVVAASYLVGTAVRLVAGVALAWVAGVTGAVLGTLVGEVAALIVLGYALRRRSTGSSVRIAARDVLVTGAVVTGLFVFSTVDLFLARHHLPGVDSGGYVAAATIGKTVLALPAAAVSVVYPRLVAAWGTPRARQTLLSAVAVVALPGAMGALVVVLAPGTVLAVLYGSGSFGSVAGVVQVLAAVAGLTALVSALTHAALARRGAAAFVVWGGAGVEVALIELWHASAAQIAAGSAVAIGSVLLVLLATEARAWFSPKSAPALPSA